MRLWLPLAAVLPLNACAHDLHRRAQRQASEELHCVAPGLRVRAVGMLQSRAPRAEQVSVFDAEGCDDERRYFCTASRGCAPTLALVPKETRAGLERALWLLRTETRGRCPGEAQRVIQESESLFVLETCDGRWDYHCRDAGCERLH
jgi:hypothetical protein